MERLLVHLAAACGSIAAMTGYRSTNQPQADMNEWWNRYKAIHHAIVQAINDGPSNGWPDVDAAAATGNGLAAALLGGMQQLLARLPASAALPPGSTGSTTTLPPGGGSPPAK